MPKRINSILPCLLVVTCGPTSPSVSSTDESTTTGSVSTSTSMDVTPTSSGGETSSTSTDSTSMPVSETTGSGSTTAAPREDLGAPTTCGEWGGTYVQDCPPGQKCTYHEDFPSFHQCVPIAEDPAQFEEPCVVNGEPGKGIDNCDEGLLCFDVDDEGHGKCIAFCREPFEDPCPENLVCFATAEAFLDLCSRPCNPLLQDCPVASDTCRPRGQFWPGEERADGNFWCHAPHPKEPGAGMLNEPCYYPDECSKGLVCLHSMAAVECGPGEACCQPFCDTDAPNTCPGQGQECVQWFPESMVPPGQENIGVCVVPA